MVILDTVIVCGGRNGQPYKLVPNALDSFVSMGAHHVISHVIVGSYRGTDRQAFDWAMRKELDASILNAKWRTGKIKGPAEGPIRNRRMPTFEKTPKAVLAFPGDSGTKDMRSVAKSLQLPLWVYCVTDVADIYAWHWENIDDFE